MAADGAAPAARTITLSPAATLFHADCRAALRVLPADSLDSCVTDPPYALVSTLKRFANSPRTEASMPTAGPYERASRGFMGQTWDTGETAFAVEFWAEVFRVLKPGAFVGAFGATRGYHRLACAIEDAGFEIRDSLAWLYGTGFPKSHDVALDFETTLCERVDDGKGGKEWRYLDDGAKLEKGEWRHPAAIEWEGWGTALKPAFEPIVLARKPLSEGTVAANVLRWRTGALNIDATRIHVEGESTAREYTAKRTAPGATQNATGERKLDGVTFAGVSKEGRWPANVVHDGSAEVVEAFPNNGPTKARRGRRTGRAELNGWGMAEQSDVVMGHDDPGGSAARFFYSAKASKADRAGSKHPTVKPVALMQWLARLVTPPGGTVLDPFAGSGTTGAAAVAEGFNCIMCEREAEYVRDICSRFADLR